VQLGLFNTVAIVLMTLATRDRSASMGQRVARIWGEVVLNPVILSVLFG
jgi:hypothetical protein